MIIRRTGVIFPPFTPYVRVSVSEITFTTISGANAPQAAEFALMAMLSLGYHLPERLSMQRKADWDSKRMRQLKPVQLRNSTVGIIGYGSVGRELARLLQSFDVTILATKLDVMHPGDDDYTIEGKGDPEGHLFHRLYPVQAMHSLLKACDFVVISLPLTEKTRNLIGKDELGSMKTHACLVNLSHKQIVNMDALLNALNDRLIGGAFLDVFQDEPPPQENLAWKLNNLVLSPRIAWLSTQDMDGAMTLFAENLKRYTSGAVLLNRYDSKRGY